MIQIIFTDKDAEQATNWLQNIEGLIMATKEEVLADLEAIKAEVAATKGAADSAVVLLNQVLARVGAAAASAADLDSFRSDLAMIMSGTKATEDELRAVVEANPQA